MTDKQREIVNRMSVAPPEYVNGIERALDTLPPGALWRMVVRDARLLIRTVRTLQAEIARLRALLPPEHTAGCGSRALVSDGCVASMGKCDCGVAQ